MKPNKRLVKRCYIFDRGVRTFLHPGYYLQQAIAREGLSKQEFAERAHLPLKTVRQICRGKGSITPVIAACIATVVVGGASTWLNMQEVWDEVGG